MDRITICIIGGGVIGLAVARGLSRNFPGVILLEKHPSFGQETSSRNSEVIHAGIYYPPGSIKATLCVEGSSLLYVYLGRHGIAHKRLGKIIVAASEEEIADLNFLKQNGEHNGCRGLELLSQSEIRKLEPEIECVAGLYSPNTGILDTHALMAKLAAEAGANGAILTYGTEVEKISRTPQGYRITIAKDHYEFESRIVVNCAGLHADRVAAMIGLDIDQLGYRLRFCKGDYFRANRKYNIQRLIYPVPSHSIHSLGIHLTQDLAGGVRFGPDAENTDHLHYDIDPSKRNSFAEAIHRYLPQIEAEDLRPDTSGLRPQLQRPSDGFKDFLIRHETDHGLPGFINLIGIESPGLTSCLAVAETVDQIVREIY